MHYIGREIKMTQNLIQRLMDTTTRLNSQGGVSFSVKQICGYLYCNSDKPIYQKDLEKVFSLRRSSASAQLKKMEEKGLITREGIPEDKRLKEIKLTTLAEKEVEKTIEEIKNIEAVISGGITEDEAEALLKILKKIRLSIENRLSQKQ